jgi:hypothetical protein
MLDPFCYGTGGEQVVIQVPRWTGASGAVFTSDQSANGARSWLRGWYVGISYRSASDRRQDGSPICRPTVQRERGLQRVVIGKQGTVDAHSLDPLLGDG